MFAKLRIAAASGLVLAATLFVAAPNVAATSAPVPFVLTISGIGGFSSPSSVYFIGSGYSLHMGTVRDNGAATDFSAATACANGGINNNHTEVFTASDGSTLTVLSHDVACWVSPSEIRCSVCPWSVTGGTGHFANARGTGNLDGYLDLATGTFRGTYTGTMSY